MAGGTLESAPLGQRSGDDLCNPIELAPLGASAQPTALGSEGSTFTGDQARVEIRALWSRIRNLEADRQVFERDVDHDMEVLRDQVRELRRLVRALSQAVQIHG